MSVDELVFATHNPHKLKEIQQMLPGAFQVISLTALDFHQEIEETGATIEENSALKSRTIHEAFGKPVFADDSGLEVDVLNGAPGVYSARYAGPEKDDTSNWKKLLEALKEVPGDQRGAQFKAVITLIMSDSEIHQFTGIVRGQITQVPRGDGGFGYDPVFIPDGYDRTFAQMAEQEKNKISHRAVAVQKLVDYLSSLR